MNKIWHKMRRVYIATVLWSYPIVLIVLGLFLIFILVVLQSMGLGPF